MSRIFRILMPVADIERAATFYRTLFGWAGQRVSPGRHYFDCGGVVLACFDPQADGDGYDAAPLPEPVYVAVDDLEAAYERARNAGAIFSDVDAPGIGKLGEISRRPWGEVSFYFSDPFDNPLCFVSTESVFTGDKNRN